jgi:hypothetical protein
MWLPTPVYERAPQIWLLMAVLFVILGLYIGFDYMLTYFYVLLGVICALRGAHIRNMRRIYRQSGNADTETDGESLPEAATH